MSTRRIGLVCGILLLGATGRGGSAPAEPHDPSLYPVLDTDPKLRQKITLERAPGTLGDLLVVVGKKAGIELTCQGDYLGRKVVERVVDQEVREVLTQIGIQAHGIWLKRKGVYWLLDQQQQALLPFLLGGASIVRAMDLVHQFIGSLSARQWAQLRAGGGLVPEDLSPSQQNWFVSAWNQEYGLHPNHYSQETWFSKKGGLITYDAAVDKIVLWMPRVSETGQIEHEPSPFLRVPVHRSE